jgi:hypothetical protein
MFLIDVKGKKVNQLNLINIYIQSREKYVIHF